ncbi:MAG: hypothetical protein HY910_12130 [Desulfarculus sp.]|nr:hypothetical protein [Desulfarculus sp.]
MPRNLLAWRVYQQVYDQLRPGETITVVTPLGATSTSGPKVLDLATVIKIVEYLDPDEDDRLLLLTKVRLFHDTIRGELARQDGAGR